MKGPEPFHQQLSMAKQNLKKSPRKPPRKSPLVAATKAEPKKGAGTGMNDIFIGFFGVAFLLSFSLNFMHSTEKLQHSHETPIHDMLDNFKSTPLKATAATIQQDLQPVSQIDDDNEAGHDKDDDDDDDKNSNAKEEQDKQDLSEHALEIHSGGPIMSKLNCDRFGGPSEEIAQELVYWEEIPSDASYISPFHLQSQSEERYMTFEPDGGGWNNIRMAMESTFGLAVAMGRTLVMPPQKKMYLLGKNKKGGQQQHFSFVDFFPIEELADEHVGLNIITMEEYLNRVAMKGEMKNKITGLVEFPPGNRTDWNGIDMKDYDLLRGYLRNVTITAQWNPGQCLPSFPASGDHKDVELLQKLAHDIIIENDGNKNFMDKYFDNPVPVDSSAKLRLEENLAGRTKLCVYNETLQNEHTLHFQCNHKAKLRMLVHFYAFLFFEDWREDVWMKRFVRDHIRYKDEIQCAAARIVAAVRERATQKDPDGNPDGIFDSFHVRRGDFQYKATRISAEQLFENSKEELVPGSTVFIATDERDKSFFDPMKVHYDVVFLDDFMHLLQGINTNYYGMIDQLVASRGKTFFGCFFSTFTGYINRIRGYHSVHEKAPGYELGTLPTTYYYSPKNRKNAMLQYAPLKPGFFNRENPISWRDINKGIGMLHSAAQ